MNAWIVVCLVLRCSIADNSMIPTASTCSEGDIQVSINHPNFKAGILVLCQNGKWRDVCHHRWDSREADVVCRQLGFPAQGAQSCTYSCFGSNYHDKLEGQTDFACNGSETRLSDCASASITGQRARDKKRCNVSEYAGVMCYNTSVSLPAGPPVLLPSSPSLATDSQTCPTGVLGGVLGTVSAILFLILVGVIIGWVWSCRKKVGKRDDNFTNPTHTSTSQRSPTEFRTTPIGHTPHQGLGEHEDGVYHVLGEGQEEGGGQTGGRAVEMVYSSLHHN